MGALPGIMSLTLLSTGGPVAEKPILTTESGAPVADNQNSQTAGPGGPTVLQDQYLIEKLARFNRERIPERVVHAVGTGAYGYLEVTNPDVPKWTKTRVFERVGKKTDMFIRFSTVAASRGGVSGGSARVTVTSRPFLPLTTCRRTWSPGRWVATR